MAKSIQFARCAYRHKRSFSTPLGLGLHLWAFRYLRKHSPVKGCYNK